MGERPPLPVVALISGSGTNLQALIDAQLRGAPFRLAAVISNRADALGLERARRHDIPTRVLSHRDYSDRESFDSKLAELIDAFTPGLVVLAGFMRILTAGFVDRYQGRMMNIHPSLLPKFRGLHTHQRAIDAGEAEHGASVHFVTAELDGGPVILQARVPVQPDDDAESLAARVLEREHLLYPTAVSWFAEGRLQLGEDGHPHLDARPLLEPRTLEPPSPAQEIQAAR
ncbi:phosphoribosylglycinamide formyltransferase [Thiorhodococcus mannitoliphagus]|uniref:Phosphoribosylglycinamide formyltransferase n=1 Tax=Thiorhodococcus mannitoliphagus TaxID=329406 RepID=A0A6P1E3C0_9GAMM|nr:phosphoribosylglycinamide formyltransferase [Thiorhodococcus mannitoliphagus]NEX22524.1 phosphoribosylglycinamide formyltransferase [Thiorhodococcus mannitoliphagus]